MGGTSATLHDPMVWETAFAYFIKAAAALFPLVNPFGVVPLFMSLTEEMKPVERFKLGSQACLVAAALMVSIMLIGEVFMQFLNVSLPSVRIAIGLIICYMGLAMLFARFPSEIPTAEQVLRSGKYAFMPLGFPGLSGAGALSIVIGFSSFMTNMPSFQEKVVGHTVAISAILAVCMISWLILLVASRFTRKSSRQGWEALGRAMGILKVCIGIQFAANGVISFMEMARASS
jgi:multiple antibiotic resistance protein